MAKASRALPPKRSRIVAPDPASDAALLALPTDHAAPPDMPVAIALAEYKALFRLATRHARPLIRHGVMREQVAAFEKLIRRLPALEKAWQKQRAGALSSNTRRKKVAEAEALKKKLLSAGNFAFRKDPEALGILAGIAEGTGVADTINDLSDLHDFWSSRGEKLAVTKATTADVARAAVLSAELDEVATEEAASTEAAQAQALRNRCFWAASAVADELRATGRYAFEDEPAIAAKYTSRYRAQIARRARRKKAAKPTPTDDKQPS